MTTERTFKRWIMGITIFRYLWVIAIAMAGAYQDDFFVMFIACWYLVWDIMVIEPRYTAKPK